MENGTENAGIAVIGDVVAAGDSTEPHGGTEGREMERDRKRIGAEWKVEWKMKGCGSGGRGALKGVVEGDIWTREGRRAMIRLEGFQKNVQTGVGPI